MAFFLLIFLFGVGAIGIGVILVRKVPLVLAVPREVVGDYFMQSSSRLYVKILRLYAWLRRGAYWDPALTVLLRVLKSLRIYILRMDRYAFSLTQAVSKRSEARKAMPPPEHDPAYWGELKPTQPTKDSGDSGPNAAA